MQNLLEQLPEELEQSLKLIKELQRRLEQEMYSGLAASPGAGVNEKHVKMAMQLGKAVNELGRETRAWLRKQRELASVAPLEERIAAVRKFIAELPPADRVDLLAGFTS